MRSSPRSSPWTVLLDGELRDDAEETTRAIARTLETAPPAHTPRAVPFSAAPCVRVSLSGGSAGYALFLGYLDQAYPEGGHERTGARLLDDAAGVLGEAWSPPALYSGFPGVAWAVRHLEGLVSGAGTAEPDGIGPSDDVDDLLKEYLQQSPWLEHYDLIGGLVGLGVYACERLPRVRAKECIEIVIERLAELALERPEGLTWWTRPEHLDPQERERYPKGWYNLGVAHGIPGIVGLLGTVRDAGFSCGQSEHLLQGAVSWLLAQTLPEGSPSRFPGHVAEGLDPVPSRMAWCYGDPGIAATLLLAARAWGEPHWEREAVSIALSAARRDPQSAGIVDASLCHGAAGLAHIFNRLFQATGEEELAGAARFWYRKTLTLRRPGEGIAGYRYWGYDGEQHLWVDAPGFLMGSAGIGLALLAGMTPIEPAWDKILLTSVPPRTI